jgi:hypothetical protein
MYSYLANEPFREMVVALHDSHDFFECLLLVHIETRNGRPMLFPAIRLEIKSKLAGRHFGPHWFLRGIFQLRNQNAIVGKFCRKVYTVNTPQSGQTEGLELVIV